MNPRLVLLLAASILAPLALAPPLQADSPPTPSPDSDWPAASAAKLPRWRGFNLDNYFMLASHRPFSEADFQMIHDFGFNFVRLPMDYRIWIVNGDWTRINEDALKPIDDAVAWGQKYHIHVCLNFHRAPGYTVAQPPEAHSLWTDPEAQRVCAMHWATFARRYKGIPSSQLSFDLFNEPSKIDPAVYAAVVAKMVDAIHKEDPDRLIIADGLSWGTVPCPNLIPLHVAQATRGYMPFEITHYQASWMKGSNAWPVPQWPLVRVKSSSYLYGPDKPDLRSPLILQGDFPAGTQIDFTVGTVSVKGRLVVKADDVPIFTKDFVSGPQSQQGEKVVFVPQYKCYQNVFSQPQSLTLAQPATHLSFSNEDGDWITMPTLSVHLPGQTAASAVLLEDTWGQRQVTLIFDAAHPDHPWTSVDVTDRAWLWQHDIVPWQQLESQGVGVMVGEWGCYNHTPYDVTLRWMEDNLINFQQAGWGWALWNFSGSFGILDSNRPGAVYEDYHGHKLDRRMLELLQKY